MKKTFNFISNFLLTYFSKNELWGLSILLLFSLLIRVLGARYGLPGTALPDEPHHINLAVYFGSGHLNPQIFKYPTLWMYTLAFLYGILFLIWSGFGLLHSVNEFAALFIWDPTLFYVSARVLAGFLGTGAILFTFLAGRKIHSSQAGFMAALLMAISPALVDLSHQAKPDMLMLFFSSVMVYGLVSYFQEGKPQWLLASGLFLGLSVSSQYTALLSAPLLLWAQGIRTIRNKSAINLGRLSKPLFLAYTLTALGFLIGTPFALFDATAFLRDFMDVLGYGHGDLTSDPTRLGARVIFHFTGLTGSDGLGLFFLSLGIISIFQKGFVRRGIFLLGPLFWVGGALGFQSIQAGAMRYSFTIYPLVSVIMGAGIILGISIVSKKFPHYLGWAVFLLLMAVPASKTIEITQNYMTPDIRLTAKAWIEENIPKDSTILMDQIFSCPPLAMNKAQIFELLSITQEINHPRAIYFQHMLNSHPGDGYTILRINRTASELVSMKYHTEWSKKGYTLVDIEGGLESVRKAQIQYIVLSSMGATEENSPRLKLFFNDLQTQAIKLKEFPSNSVLAPSLTIYKIPYS